MGYRPAHSWVGLCVAVRSVLPVHWVTLERDLLLVLWPCSSLRWHVLLWGSSVCFGAVVWGKGILVVCELELLSYFNYFLCGQIPKSVALSLTPSWALVIHFLGNVFCTFPFRYSNADILSKAELFYFLQDMSAQFFCYSTSPSFKTL